MGRILLGVLLAIACTTLLDATGYGTFSALPLIPLFVGFAWLDRIPLAQLGLKRGTPAYYGLALAHPILVIAALTTLAAAYGMLDLARFDASKAARNIALVAIATFVMAIITEEGFFRGWLWAALSKRGIAPLVRLLATTAAFVLWHVSFVFLSTDFHFAPAQIPLFFANATLLGLIWGLLRFGSGSILVSSAGHGLWNGLVYVLFGVGSGVGVLGIRDVGMFGPEVGLYGIVLNGAFAGLLFWQLRNRLVGNSPETQPGH